MLQYARERLAAPSDPAEGLHSAQCDLSPADDLESALAGYILGAQNQGVANQVHRFAEHCPNHKEAPRETQPEQAVLWWSELLFNCADDLDLFAEVRHQ